MGERRGSQRHKSFLQGLIRFDKRRGAINCLVRDVSDEGARIILSEAVTIPDSVELQIPQRGQTFRAVVQWRHADEIGLAFNDGAAAAPPARESDLAARVAQLEAEIAALRRALKRLKREKPADGDVEAA
jgi:hypothetical protein